MGIDSLFREVTRHTCQHFEVEGSLHACLGHMLNLMPGKLIFSDHYDHEHGTVHTIAEASLGGGRRLDRIVPIPPSVRSAIETSRGKEQNTGAAFIVNNVAEDPIRVRMFESPAEPLHSSLIGVYPELDDRVIGPQPFRLRRMLCDEGSTGSSIRITNGRTH